MATVKLKGNEIHTNGTMPEVGNKAPDFKLTNTELEDVTLSDCKGTTVISIFPSIDTPVCALSTKKFNDHARKHPDINFLMVAVDTPFAMARFCANEGIENVKLLSMFRDKKFAEDYGLLITDGPLAGVSARAVLVLNENHVVKHAELVDEIGKEPDYDAAFAAC
ncbi:MAG: thiol peroxidase [Gammaproteobacteria bacterium]|jgi:thioredoxin-dependent peroxiredoxin